MNLKTLTETTPNPTEATARLFDLCLRQAETCNQARKWTLPPAGLRALVDAALPWVQAAGVADGETVATILCNYYLDGPTVEALGSSDTLPQRAQAVDAWTGYLTNVIRRRFDLESEAARDIVQEAWIDTIRAVREYRFHFCSRFRTFLCGVAIHRALRTLRDARTQRRGGHVRRRSLDEPAGEDTDLRLGETITVEGSDPAHVFAAQGSELYRLVDEAIIQHCATMRHGKIPPAVKERLARLVLLDDQALHKVAAKLGLNYNTAVTVMRRIRQHLQSLPKIREFLDRSDTGR